MGCGASKESTATTASKDKKKDAHLPPVFIEGERPEPQRCRYNSDARPNDSALAKESRRPSAELTRKERDRRRSSSKNVGFLTAEEAHQRSGSGSFSADNSMLRSPVAIEPPLSPLVPAPASGGQDEANSLSPLPPAHPAASNEPNGGEPAAKGAELSLSTRSDTHNNGVGNDANSVEQNPPQ